MVSASAFRSDKYVKIRLRLQKSLMGRTPAVHSKHTKRRRRFSDEIEERGLSGCYLIKQSGVGALRKWTRG